MGCVSSALLNQDDEFRGQIGQHIVSLTSTTYGLLTLDPPSPEPQPTPTPRFTLGSVLPSPLSSEHRSLRSLPPEIINSWELMAGLDATAASESFRFSPLPIPPHSHPRRHSNPKPFAENAANKENSNPNFSIPASKSEADPPKPLRNSGDAVRLPPSSSSLDRLEKLCPPKGENRVVIYTTTLRGVRKTFEDCNAVRAAIEGLGVMVCERDISMDRGFREELRELMKGKEINCSSSNLVPPPRVFVKGRYLGGAEEVMRMVEEGTLGEVFEGLPRRLKVGGSFACEGCGGVRFLPCFRCNGSCKMAMVVVKEEGTEYQEQGRSSSTSRTVAVVRCPDCNENGLVLCPLCS